jgi:hypothetical protein
MAHETDGGASTSGSVTYYLVRGKTVAKKDNGTAYLYELGAGWVRDTGHIVSDRLIGYDPYEPSDSPYKIGNTSIMDEIEVITEGEALERVAQLNR